MTLSIPLYGIWASILASLSKASETTFYSLIWDFLTLIEKYVILEKRLSIPLYGIGVISAHIRRMFSGLSIPLYGILSRQSRWL